MMTAPSNIKNIAQYSHTAASLFDDFDPKHDEVLLEDD
jgi:hypothetical protein